PLPRRLADGRRPRAARRRPGRPHRRALAARRGAVGGHRAPGRRVLHRAGTAREVVSGPGRLRLRWVSSVGSSARLRPWRAQPRPCDPRGMSPPASVEHRSADTRLWHPFADMALVRREELVIARGEDVWVWDAEGRPYLDATASLWYANVGHGRPEIARAV